MIAVSNIAVDGTRVEQARQALAAGLSLPEHKCSTLISALSNLGFVLARNARGDFLVRRMVIPDEKSGRFLHALRTLAPFIIPIEDDKPACMITVGHSLHLGYHFEGGKMVTRPVRMELVLDDGVSS